MTYSFRLQCTDASPADPPTYRSTVLAWRQGVRLREACASKQHALV
ncbi:MAG: hypothetical protein K0Q60_2478 [Microvirga sp.]|jgi:hypothetical protein|nr:hypothetical protein [Microvirga sp.]